MANYTYGNTPKVRIQRVFEKLLDHANSDTDKLKIVSWLGERKIYVEASKPKLIEICGENYRESKDKRQKDYEVAIRPALSYYLPDFLGILEDRRGKNKGSDVWKFNLNLWSSDKEENIKRFQEEWERRKNNYEPQKPIDKSSKSISSEEEFTRGLTKMIKSQGPFFIINLSEIKSLVERSRGLPHEHEAIVKEVLSTLFPDIEHTIFRSTSEKVQDKFGNDIDLTLADEVARRIISFLTMSDV
jgi:hypothetical protein